MQDTWAAQPSDRRDGPARVVILGGGLTGISTAMHLDCPWILFEKEARLGGHARSEVKDGFCFDVTGHWLHLRDPVIKTLVDQLLPGQMQEITRKARVFSHGVLIRYPFQANLHGLPPKVVHECLMGVIEAQTRNYAGPEPRTFEDYCLRHFGAGIAKHFMIPYNERLWGVSPREITAEWCSRFVPLPNLEQIVAGAVGSGPPELGYNVRFLYPRQGGIETFARALAAHMYERAVGRGEVHTGVSPDRIDWRRRLITVGGEQIPYRALVASIPLPELLKRMQDLPPDIEIHAQRLRCTTLTYLNVATRALPAADWHWVYVPEKSYPFYRVGCFSNAMPSMAPPGMGSFYVELARRGPVADRAATSREVAEAMVAIGAIASPEEVLFAEPREIQYAYVVFDEHYYSATQAIFGFLERNAIYPRGRYGAWTYNAMEDCLLAGREVASTIAAAHGDQSR